LKGEFQLIMLYLSDNGMLSLQNDKLSSIWLTAAYRKGNKKDLEEIIMKFDEHNTHSFIIEKIEWDKRNRFSVKINNPFLEFSRDQLKPLLYRKDKLGTIFNTFIVGKFAIIIPEDDSKMLYLSPHSPDLILMHHVIGKRGPWGSLVNHDKCFYNMINALTNIWSGQGQLTYLTIACTLLYVKKPSRQLAAEFWIQAVSIGKMNNELLGKCLGKLQYGEYAPLKRFTDLTTDQMLNVSKTHNQALEKLLTQMILFMNEKPIKGSKKLVSLYKELLSINKSEMPAECKEKFGCWK